MLVLLIGVGGTRGPFLLHSLKEMERKREEGEGGRERGRGRERRREDGVYTTK